MSHKFTVTIVAMFILGSLMVVAGIHYDRLFLFIPGLIAVLLSIAIVALKARGVGYSPYLMSAVVVGCLLASLSFFFDSRSLISSVLVAPSFVFSSMVVFSFFCILGASFERILSTVFIFMINCAMSSFGMVFLYAIDGRSIGDYIGLGEVTTIEVNQMIMQQAVVTLVVGIVILLFVHRAFKKAGINRFDHDLLTKGA